MLSRRGLNRALLDRQLLLRRQTRSAADTIAHLVGMQAQAPNAPYVGLWSRLVDFRPAELADLLLDRAVVRAPLMRATVHLVTARDCLTLRPLLDPVLARGLGVFAKQIVGVDRAALAAAGRELIEQQPLTSKRLGELLRQRWPDRDATALAYAVHFLVPMLQVPPRGVWGQRMQATWTTPEAWLGRDLEREAKPDEMALRYLGAFGPATTMDIQSWSGLTRLNEVTDRLRPRLRTFQDETGRELFDLPEAPRPDPDTPAPVRFLPEYDNLLLGHADRSRVVPDGRGTPAYLGAGATNGALLVDGMFRGLWRIRRDPRGAAAILEIQPFSGLSTKDADEATEEGLRLLRFAAAADSPDVRFVAPG